MEKIQICPQIIYKFQSNEKLCEDTLNDIRGVEWTPSATNLQSSRSKSLHKEEKFATIHEWFEDCLNLIKDEIQFECERLKITQSWGNLSMKGHWHHKHMHNNSMVSGVYYLTDTNACIYFGVDNIWNYDKYTGGIIKLNYSDIDTTSIIYKHKPSKGELLLFPSTLFHAVETNNGEDRYSISFNSFADGKIGNDEFLSTINFVIQ